MNFGKHLIKISHFRLSKYVSPRGSNTKKIDRVAKGPKSVSSVKTTSGFAY